MVINDGQDPVDRDWLPNFETHAIMLGQENKDLKRAVDRVNGYYDVFYS